MDRDDLLDLGIRRAVRMSGRRCASGTELPAMSGIPSSRAVSYISFAQSQRYDRCLSLKSGTNRFERCMTATISSKNRLRGYSSGPAR